MPRVSVIIPTFDRPELLRRALASVESQSVGDLEAVIVNDGGSWPAPFVPSIGAVPVRVVQRTRGGPGAARNSGIAFSDSEYVAYLDDDDEWHPNHLESLLAILEKTPGSDMAFGVANVVADGCHIRRWGDCEFNKFILDGFHTVFPLSATVHRRSLLQKAGTFDEQPLLIGPEDCELLIRTSDFNIPIPSRQCTVTMHRDHSMTREPRTEWVDVLEYVIRKNGYGTTRNNWLMFYRVFAAAVEEGRHDAAERWADQLDRQLPSSLTRTGTAINGSINLQPLSIKAFCRGVLDAGNFDGKVCPR